ncbi:substrate-binding domain-containing protein [Actinocrispum sp. NPDC049592]|uniref:PstS family phosphate ABC transporter substrate-binding protein n=1 Tax=Actinocrispum sp. NPDC049592 TaxID=3154835 RepID=UPI00343654AC
MISVDATDFEPSELQRVMRGLPDIAIDDDLVKLPMIGLEPGHSFKLVIVLSGTLADVKQKVEVDGELRDGQITTRQGRERIRPDTLFWGGLTAICAGAFAVVLLLNNVTPFTKLPQGIACVPGALTAEGSSAFGRAATDLAGAYGAYCPAASIKVRTPGSREGLQRLVDAGSQARQLALADGRFDEFPQLVPEPLAIVPFTFVVSDNVPIDTLSLVDARRIFTGSARIWSDVTGNPSDTGEIRVVGRSTTSGTRRTLEQYVLGAPGSPVRQAGATSDSCRDRRPEFTDRQPIVCELGSTADLIDRVSTLDDSIGYADVSDVEQATGVKKITLEHRNPTLEDIRAGYQFWTVEYVYTYSRPEPGIPARRVPRLPADRRRSQQDGGFRVLRLRR